MLGIDTNVRNLIGWVDCYLIWIQMFKIDTNVINLKRLGLIVYLIWIQILRMDIYVMNLI